MNSRKEHLERLKEVQPVTKWNYSYLLWEYQLKVVISALKKYASGKLLDIGCGNKPFEDYILPLVDEYVGCDVIQSSLNKVDIICDACSIPLESEYFNTVISTQVMEHISNFNAFLGETYRLLSKKGVLILSVPFVWPVHEEPYDFYRFTEYGLRSNLDKAGFKSAKIIQAGGLWISLGLMFLSFGCKNIQNPNKLFSVFLKVYNKLFVFISNIVFAFLNCKFPCSKIPSCYLVIAFK